MADEREAMLRAELEAEAARLVEIVLDRWLPAPDPLGDSMLLPKGDDEDPVRLDDLDWAEVRRAFRERHGRAPRSGARQIARGILAERALRTRS